MLLLFDQIFSLFLQATGPQVQPFDWQRIFLGNLPWWFLAEVVVRTVIIYLYALFLVRMVSRRAISQLSLIEFLLVIALGSAVGDPMFYPDVPLLHGMVVITVVILLNKGIIRLINTQESVEEAIEGNPFLLVRDTLMQPQTMEQAHFNREKLFEQLRIRGVRHLGQVEYVFQEQSGYITVFQYPQDEEKSGLCVMPPWDILQAKEWLQGQSLPGDETLGCTACGYLTHFSAHQPLPGCPSCHHAIWSEAVVVLPTYKAKLPHFEGGAS